MRPLIYLAGLMLIANTALAQTAGANGHGGLFGTGTTTADTSSRAGLLFEVQTAPGAGSLQLRTSAIDFGGEFSTPIAALGNSAALGSMIRYHVSLTYSNVSANGTSGNGFKLAPLGFGWVLPVYRQGPLHIEVEGVLSALEFQLFSVSNSDADVSGADMNFSTGVYAQVTASYGPAYVSLAPLGIDFSWFSIATGSGDGSSSSTTAGGFSPEYRFQLSGGLNF